MRETGDVTPTDLAQTEARLSRGLAELNNAEVNLAVSRAAYRQVIGVVLNGSHQRSRSTDFFREGHCRFERVAGECKRTYGNPNEYKDSSARCGWICDGDHNDAYVVLKSFH